MATIIKKGDFTVHILSKLDKYSDGFIYYVKETGFESPSEQIAINNGMAWLKKQYQRFLRKLNKGKTVVDEVKIKVLGLVDADKFNERFEKKKIKRYRTKRIKKAPKVKKLTKVQRRRTIFTVQDEENLIARKLQLAIITAKLEKNNKPKVKRRRTK